MTHDNKKQTPEWNTISDVLDERKIDPLLKKPKKINLKYQKKLKKSYDEARTCYDEYFTKVSSIVRPVFPVTLYYYSDNGGKFDDTASKEIKRFLNDTANIVSLLSGIEKPQIEYENTPAQNWNSSGFELAQTTRYGLNGVGNITFLNCAPRLDERGREDNKTNRGEPIYIGILPNGHVVSANSRYNLVHFYDAVKNGGIEFFEANVQTDGTQFRSRDIFPLYATVLANRLTQNIEKWNHASTLEERRELLGNIGFVNLDKPLSLEDIPKPIPFSVAHIDVHGNIKLNIRESDIHARTKDRINGRKIKIGNKVLNVKIKKTTSLFGLKTRQVGLYKGSSGAAWQAANNDDGFLELAVVGGNLAEQLGLSLEELKDIQVVEFLRDPTSAEIQNVSDRYTLNNHYNDDSLYKNDSTENSYFRHGNALG